MTTPKTLEFAAGDVSFMEAEQSNGEKLTRVSINAYNGGALRLGNFRHPVVLALDSATFSTSPMPILKDHDAKRPVGHTIEQQIGDSIDLVADLSVPSQDTDRIAQASTRGFPWKASIGANGYTLDFVKAGTSVNVNGQTFRGPVYVARNAKVYETSILSLAADATSAVDLAAQHSFGEATVDKELREYIEARGFDPEALSTEQVDYFRAQMKEVDETPEPEDKGKVEAGTDSADDLTAKAVSDLRAAMKEEHKRLEGVRKALEGRDALLATALDEDWDVGKAETEALKAELSDLRSGRGQGVHVQVGGGSAPTDAKTLECSLALSSSVGCMSEEDAVAEYGEQTVEAARRQGDMSMHGVMAGTIRAAGMTVGFGTSKSNLVDRYYDAHRKLEASGYSGLTLTSIFQNVANKRLLQRYQRVASVIPEFTTKRSVSDFKPVTEYRVEDLGELEQLGKGGTIEHGDLTESTFSYRLTTYAKMLTLTREMQINDDMGALNNIIDLLATMSWKVHERLGVQKLINASFYTGSNSFSGASTALDIDSVILAEQRFNEQTDASGHPISVPCDRIIHGPSLKRLANQLYNDATVITGEDLTRHSSNEARGILRPVMTPYLSNALVTGSSATQYYVLANPDLHPAFTRTYLNGVESPQLSSGEVDFSQLGMSWRSVFDFAFGELDPKGVHKYAGA